MIPKRGRWDGSYTSAAFPAIVSAIHSPLMSLSLTRTVGITLRVMLPHAEREGYGAQAHLSTDAAFVFNTTFPRRHNQGQAPHGHSPPCRSHPDSRCRDGG